MVIIDVAASVHGQMMLRCASVVRDAPEIRWLAPSLDLPAALRALTDVDAVAVPVGVRGAGPLDHFTRAVVDALAALCRDGVGVFVAAGSHRVANLLATAPGVVSVGPMRGGRHPARLRVAVPHGAGSSGAAVRAAALCVLFRHHRLRVCEPTMTERR